jgi:hypothetical protein
VYSYCGHWRGVNSLGFFFPKVDSQWYQLDRRLVGSQGLSRGCTEDETLLSLLEIEPKLFACLACGLVVTPPALYFISSLFFPFLACDARHRHLVRLTTGP